MAITRFKIFANLYKDSVALMQLGAQLREREGIAGASCLMATPANLAQLEAADLSVEATTLPSDLLVVVRGDATACDEAMVVAEALLKSHARRKRRWRRGVFDAADQPRAGPRKRRPTPTWL